MAYNLVDDALSEVKVRANLPSSNGALTDAELLAIGNAELNGILSGRLLEAMQGYLLTEATQAMSAGVQAYDIPTRAVGNKLSYVSCQDGSGNRRGLAAKSGQTVADLDRSVSSYALPQAFYWLGTQVAVWPIPNGGTESLVFGYYKRPSRMVLSSACAKVTAAAVAGATSVSVSNSAGQFVGGVTVDAVQATPHFRITTMDMLLGGAGAAVLSLSAPGLTSAVAVGDWFCPAGDSCIIQLPVEVQPLLVARWALKVMKARAPASPDTQAMGQDVGDLEASLFDFLSQRTEGQPETLGPSGLLFGYAPSFRTY